MASCDRAFSKLIDSVLLGEPPPAKWAKLRAHLKGCTACRDRYNRVALAERMLHGGPSALDTPSPASLARVGAALFDAAPEKVTPRGLAALPRWIYGALAFGAAAAILPFVVRVHQGPEAPEFAARGAATDLARQAGLRAYCLGGHDGDEVRPLDPGATPPRCAASELLKFSYSNQAGYEELFLVGFDAGWAIKWYEPRPPSTLSIPAARAVDQPLGGAIRVGVNHAPGPLRVYALFAHAPLSGREIEEAAARLRQRGAALAEVTALPLDGRDDVVQRSLLIEVTPAR